MAASLDGDLFTAPGLYSDVILLVEGRQLHVNKTVLALASPVFQKMFFGEFKEKQSDEIPLPEKKYTEILDFLFCIYPSTSREVKEENVESLLELADEYNVNSLKERCRVFLANFLKIKKTSLDKEKLVRFLALADRYELEDVVDICMADLVYHEYGDIKGLQELGVMDQISAKTQIKFFKNRLILVEKLVRSVLVNSYSSGGKLIDDFEVLLTNQCKEFTHRHSRHECRECKGMCCARCRKLAKDAMDDLAHAIKNVLPAFKESE